MYGGEDLTYSGEASKKPKEEWRGLADDIFGVPEDMNMNQNDMGVYLFNAKYDSDNFADFNDEF